MSAPDVFTVERFTQADGSTGWRVTAGPSNRARVDLVAALDQLTHDTAALVAALAQAGAQ